MKKEKGYGGTEPNSEPRRPCTGWNLKCGTVIEVIKAKGSLLGEKTTAVK
jgi:hypothetical protein